MSPLVDVGQIVDGLAFVIVEDRPILRFQGVSDVGVLDDDPRTVERVGSEPPL